MKRYIFGFATLVMLMTLSLGRVQAQMVMEKPTPYISVNGYSEIKVAPDEIFLSITLDEGDTKGKVTLEEQRKAMFQALKRLKINLEEQLKVVDMSSDYFRRKSSLATTKYELKVGSATEAREVFEALDAAKISNVNVVRAQNSKFEEYRIEARKAAIRDAKAKAMQLAEAIDQSIGPCFEINDYNTSSQPVVVKRASMMYAANMDSVAEEAFVEPDIEFEQIRITYNISAKFELHWK